MDVRLLAAATVVTAVADTATPSSSPLGDWVQLINLPLSILILYGFARGWFITGKEHERVVAERDQERAERIEAQKALTDKALPMLQTTETTMAALVKSIEGMESRRRS